ncbi:hypothetical protein Q6350_10295 [Isoptericola sp. b515]|uniref:hypothetical protein n=1 Tax=Isoptericola sp. b515 TaxID=3064652 RepID=UPI0027141157|nr:hypothetical protein [Isoptericola sp. b515]MDO8148821.1 hypothetical protein [Isoptericola sp. b515]
MTGSPSLRGLTPIQGFLLGVGTAVVSLLPWFVAGLQAPPMDGPPWLADARGALLPLNLMTFVRLGGIVVLPGAAIGLVLRRGASGSTGRAAWAAAAGLAVVFAGATVQSLTVILPRLRPDSPAALNTVLGAVAVGILLVLSVVVCRLLAFGSVPAATVAAAVGAVAAGFWLPTLLLPPPGIVTEGAVPTELMRALFRAVELAPAVLTGLALAWCGWTPLRRLAAWALAVLILWIGPAALPVLAHWGTPGGPSLVAHFPLVLDDLERSLDSGLPYPVTALVIGVVGQLAVLLVRRRQRARQAAVGAVPTA